jgi:hypothetical protein
MVPLPLLPRRLAALPGVRKPGPEYRDVYAAAVNGVIDATWENGRWYVDEADLPAIALKLGLAMLAPAEPVGRRPRRSEETVEAA